jgi:hypothetical protein
MKQTIIIGTLEFLNRKTIVHSIDEVYQADSTEELVALIDTFDKEGRDWLILDSYTGVIEFTIKGLLDFIWGSNNKPPITNNATNEGGQKV